MRRSKIFALTLLALTLSMPAVSGAEDVNTDFWTFDQMAPDLRQRSCPAGTEDFPFSTVDIVAKPVELGAPKDVKRSLPDGVEFVGGWHLTAKNSDFGGLSGLDMTEAGDLITVSDRGTFLKIGMANGAPDGRAEMSVMLRDDGNRLSGKRNVDAEGLAYRDGLALVSFERNHRILAFNLADCGGAARGVAVSQLPDEIAGQSVAPNSGAEALWLGPDGRLTVGYETIIDQQASLLTLNSKGDMLSPPALINVPEDFRLVGASGPALLLRAFSRERGNRNEIRIIDQDLIFQLTPPLNVDNFEGIVLTEPKNGLRRLYMISDDNFSGRQRTLLYAFDIRMP